MKYIGRIITKSKMVPKYELILVTDKYEENESLPTIIVGKGLAQSIIGEENFSLLEHKVKDNLWWTFSEMEHRVFFEKDMKIFYDALIATLSTSVRYSFFNFYRNSLTNIKYVAKYLFKGRAKIHAYIANNDVYFTSRDKVWAISLTDCEFLGVKKDKVLRKLFSNTNIIFVDGRKCAFPHLFNALKGDNRHLIPYLSSLID